MHWQPIWLTQWTFLNSDKAKDLMYCLPPANTCGIHNNVTSTFYLAGTILVGCGISVHAAKSSITKSISLCGWLVYQNPVCQKPKVRSMQSPSIYFYARRHLLYINAALIYAHSACNHHTLQCGCITAVKILLAKNYRKHGTFGSKMAMEAISEHLI